MPVNYIAEIEWLTAEAGGRKSPPPGPTYSAPVRFEDESWEAWAKEAWTLVAQVIECSDAYHWKANVAFLVGNAPQERLMPGARFEFYEGRRCVARGRVLGT